MNNVERAMQLYHVAQTTGVAAVDLLLDVLTDTDSLIRHVIRYRTMSHCTRKVPSTSCARCSQ